MASSLRVCRKDDFNFLTPGNADESAMSLCWCLRLVFEFRETADDDSPVLCAFSVLTGPIAKTNSESTQSLKKQRKKE